MENITSEKGIALLIVLWIMAILMVMVVSFSLMVRGETFSTIHFKKSMENKMFAEAGMEHGIMEIIYYLANVNQTVILEGKETWKTDGTAQYGRMEGGNYRVRIIDESGKISLNGMTDASGIILKNLLVNLDVSPEAADTIVDSILDWKDGDDLQRLNGAESNYYLTLPKPYKAKNADFETLDELIRVKGMTSEILYGTKERKGIIRFLTIRAATQQININAASREVLAALPGMNGVQADQIIEFRKSSTIRSLGDLKDLVGGVSALTMPFIIIQQTASPPTYTIESVGFTDDEKKGYPITATISMESASKYRVVYYRSPEEAVQ